ncbi:hypothetical protein GOV06_04425 [Candidatus Woesearchaeota archaeon]|nr:hypothetical protein [Candidatus Woesearchaeota archaeon]
MEEPQRKPKNLADCIKALESFNIRGHVPFLPNLIVGHGRKYSAKELIAYYEKPLSDIMKEGERFKAKAIPSDVKNYTEEKEKAIRTLLKWDEYAEYNAA